MSYTPTTWQTGDTITAEKLNKMEGGIAEAIAPYDSDRIVSIEGEFSGNILAITSAAPSRADYMALIRGEKSLVCHVLIYGYDHAFLLSFCEIDERNNADIAMFYGRLNYDGYDIHFSYSLADDGNAITQSYFVNIGQFIVTLTPTAQDYSGIMSKTPQEISFALRNGWKIMFDFPSLSASVEATQFIGDRVACANITFDIGGQNVLIQIVTSASDSTYSTKIFPLTPMS